MESRWIMAIVFAFAVCHVTDAQLQTANLTTNITQSGCGTTKVCQPSSCNPSNSSCFFSSVQIINQAFIVELSGPVTGYIALGLTLNKQSPNSTIVFACGNNNSVAFFQTATKKPSEESLTPTTMTTVNSVQSAIKANQIQCIVNVSVSLNVSGSIFNLSNDNATLAIFSGNTNGTQLGNATTSFASNTSIDLAAIGTKPSTSSPFNITRSACAQTKLCISSLATCDPSGNSSCFFTSVQSDGNSLLFELSGTTSGYVALVLKKTGTNVVFVCGNNKTGGSNNAFLGTYSKNGNSYVLANVSTVNSFKGFASQTLVQCIFNTSAGFNVTTRAEDLNFNVSIENGTISENGLGAPTTLVETTSPVDLSNPKSTMNTTSNASTSTTTTTSTSTTTTTTTTTTGSSDSITCHWTQVMAVLLGALALHFM